jgi:hypothetical protein
MIHDRKIWLDFIETKKVSLLKLNAVEETVNKVKRQAPNWEKIFVKCTSHKEQ